MIEQRDGTRWRRRIARLVFGRDVVAYWQSGRKHRPRYDDSSWWAAEDGWTRPSPLPVGETVDLLTGQRFLHAAGSDTE